MKNNNLFGKSMLLVMIPVLVISLIIGIVTLQGIKEFFKKESFEVLNNELEIFQNNNKDDFNGIRIPLPNPENRDKQSLSLDPPAFMKPNKSARSTIIVETKNGDYHVPGDVRMFIKIEADNIKNNVDWPIHGQTSIQSETVFYAITPIEDGAFVGRIKEQDYKNLYYLAYISESYSKDLTYEVMFVFVIGLSILIVLIASVLYVVFKKISIRLKSLEEGTQRIGKGEFDTNIPITPNDEIGRLGNAMNHMGKQLGLIREEQAENFQMISHELKTPIMVMQGYIDALIHEQYPNGTKEATMKILVEELNKLEKLTKDILFLNKTEYLARNSVVMTDLKLSDIFVEVTKRLKLESTINIIIEGEHELIADKKSWIRVVENIISNQLRYAKSEIKVNLSSKISIKNDGKCIDSKIIDKIKNPFVKGESGHSGLGLTIIDHTLKLYDYELSVNNCDDGVEYLITKQNN